MSATTFAARSKGRLELLGWLNELLETDYTKIEQLADGIAYCQILDAIHPGKVLLHKLNFNAKYEEDYVKNLKILDQGFSAADIDYNVPVVKLARGKFQDNNEFLQWCYQLVQKTYPLAHKEYKGLQRRQEAQSKKGGKAGGHRRKDINRDLLPNAVDGGGMRAQSGKVVRTVMDISAAPEGTASPTLLRTFSKTNERDLFDASALSSGGPAVSGGNQAPLSATELKRKAELDNLIVCLTSELKDRFKKDLELKEISSNLLTERTFYFNKLRSIEKICDRNSSSAHARHILSVLEQSLPAFENQRPA